MLTLRTSLQQSKAFAFVVTHIYNEINKRYQTDFAESNCFFYTLAIKEKSICRSLY